MLPWILLQSAAARACCGLPPYRFVESQCLCFYAALQHQLLPIIWILGHRCLTQLLQLQLYESMCSTVFTHHIPCLGLETKACTKNTSQEYQVQSLCQSPWPVSMLWMVGRVIFLLYGVDSRVGMSVCRKHAVTSWTSKSTSTALAESCTWLDGGPVPSDCVNVASPGISLISEVDHLSEPTLKAFKPSRVCRRLFIRESEVESSVEVAWSEFESLNWLGPFDSSWSPDTCMRKASQHISLVMLPHPAPPRVSRLKTDA